MALSYFVIPDTSTIVYEGDIVVLSEYSDNFAIASHGWYEYQETRANGWYFILLPSREIIPAANINVSLITVVTSTACPKPFPTPIPDPDEDTEHSTFITLNNITERDGLVPEFIPNGRIVRVNDTVSGEPEYYEWDAESKEWKTWDISASVVATSSALDESVNILENEIEQTIAELTTVQNRVTTLESTVGAVDAALQAIINGGASQ